MTDRNASTAGGDSPPDLWDPLVRISHWGIAVVVLGNAVLNQGGGVWHIWLGWTGLVLLVLRLLWGLVGPHEARFSAFPPNPVAALAHLGDLLRGKPKSHRSHNPAGALMVYALWACLGVVIATGVMMSGPSPFRAAAQAAAEQAAITSGDWSVLVKTDNTEQGDAGDGESSRGQIKEVHEMAANLILMLVVLHLAGVVMESRLMRRNLVQPMLLGLPARPGPAPKVRD